MLALNEQPSLYGLEAGQTVPEQLCEAARINQPVMQSLTLPEQGRGILRLRSQLSFQDDKTGSRSHELCCTGSAVDNGSMHATQKRVSFHQQSETLCISNNVVHRLEACSQIKYVEKFSREDLVGDIREPETKPNYCFLGSYFVNFLLISFGFHRLSLQVKSAVGNKKMQF
jgi:hypothetical protein